MIPASLSRRFVELNANLQLVNVDNAGHCVHDECPEQVNQILLDWLDVKYMGFSKPTLLAKSNIV
jgi:haloalkane dehalogenase